MTMEPSYTLACKYCPQFRTMRHVSHSLSSFTTSCPSLPPPHGLLLSFLKNNAFTNSFQNPIHPFIAAIVFNTRT